MICYITVRISKRISFRINSGICVLFVIQCAEVQRLCHRCLRSMTLHRYHKTYETIFQLRCLSETSLNHRKSMGLTLHLDVFLGYVSALRRTIASKISNCVDQLNVKEKLRIMKISWYGVFLYYFFGQLKSMNYLQLISKSLINIIY